MIRFLLKLYSDLAQLGQNQKTGEGLSPKTILEHHHLISTILDSAYKDMLVDVNVADRATPPKVDKKRPNYFQPEQLRLIRECADQEPINRKTLLYLLIATGARRGEIAGLKWKNYDAQTGLLLIDSTILRSKTAKGVESEKTLYETTPKTEASIRYVKLPKAVMTVLDEYRQWQSQQKDLWGDRWKESPYILTATQGGPLFPDTINNYFKWFRKKYNLDFRINPHAFRHSAASILISEGVDLTTVSGMLGHASATTTANIYSHEVAAAKAKAAAVIANKLFDEK